MSKDSDSGNDYGKEVIAILKQTMDSLVELGKKHAGNGLTLRERRTAERDEIKQIKAELADGKISNETLKGFMKTFRNIKAARTRKEVLAKREAQELAGNIDDEVSELFSKFNLWYTFNKPDKE